MTLRSLLIVGALAAGCTRPELRAPARSASASRATAHELRLHRPAWRRGPLTGPAPIVAPGVPLIVEPMSPTTSGFSVRYRDSRDPAHARLRAVLERNHVLERVAAVLNHAVRMPVAVELQTVDCGMVNAFYDERTRRITVCYELIDHFLDVFRRATRGRAQLDDAVVGATLFTFYHEAAHGLIQLLDLPAVGREEDSADQLATLALLGMGRAGAQMALDGARWFRLQARASQHVTQVWDEHAFDAQRFYNVVCLIYGSNPGAYAWLVTGGWLPAERAGRCPAEYGKISRAWGRLLRPYDARVARLSGRR